MRGSCASPAVPLVQAGFSPPLVVYDAASRAGRLSPETWPPALTLFWRQV